MPSIYFTCLLAVLLYTSTGAAHKIESYLRRDVSSEQWKYFKRVTGRWRGLWIQVNATASVVLSTKFKNYFEKIPGGRNGLPAYLQTFVFNNLAFSPSGLRKLQYIYTKTKPPTWGQLLYPDGTLSESALAGQISFFPYGSGHTVYGTVSTNFFAEVYILHPVMKGVRLTPSFQYLDGKFANAYIAREVADVNAFPAMPWKGGQAVAALSEAESQPGPRTEVTHCLRQYGLIYERYVRVSTHGVAAIPTGEDFVTLRLRGDPVTLSVPKVFAPMDGELDVMFYIDWFVSDTVYLRNIFTFTPDGRIKRHCTSAYFKIDALD